MSQSLQIIDELEAALRSNSSERHHSILKSVTGLFLAGCDSMSEEITGVFDDVIGRLVNHVESRARVELSGILAPLANAPHNVIQRLAGDDDIKVAGPVLAQSSSITEQTLVAIAESKSQPHLSKIAERRELSPGITDVLVERGDREVVGKVAINDGARFSESGMSMLAMRATGDEDLTLAVARRRDISSVLFKRLLSYATEEVRRRMLAAADLAHRDAINNALERIAKQAGCQLISAKEYAAAQRLVHSFSQDTEQTRAKVLQFADGNLVAELIAALSILSAVPIVLVARLIRDVEPFSAMVLCRAIGLEWYVAHAVLNSLPSMCEDRERKFADMEAQYARLSTESAERLLVYWQGCQERQQLPN